MFTVSRRLRRTGLPAAIAALSVVAVAAAALPSAATTITALAAPWSDTADGFA